MAEPKEKETTAAPEAQEPPIREGARAYTDPVTGRIKKLDFTLSDKKGRGAAVKVKAAKNVPLSMLEHHGARIPKRLARGRIERGTEVYMSKAAADRFVDLGYFTR